jgi:hypothetical protein
MNLGAYDIWRHFTAGDERHYLLNTLRRRLRPTFAERPLCGNAVSSKATSVMSFSLYG